MPNALCDGVFKTPCTTVASLSSAAWLALQQARAAHQWNGVTVTQRSPVTGHDGRLFLICEFGRAMVVCRKKSSFLLGKVGAVGVVEKKAGSWFVVEENWVGGGGGPEECSFFPLGTQPNRNIIMK